MKNKRKRVSYESSGWCNDEKSGEIMIFGKKGIIMRKQVRTKELAIVRKKIFTKIREQSKKKK